MTNEQSYAGLLERLTAYSDALEAMRVGVSPEASQRLAKVTPALSAKAMAEAAEAISSLLKRVGELEDKAQGLECDYRVALGKLGGLVHFLRAMRRSDAGAIEEYVSRKCAALNSDAPLSIGEGL